MILIMSGERGCGAWVPNEMAERRSSAEDTGQTYRHAQAWHTCSDGQATRKQVLTKKMRGPLGKKIVQKSRNSWVENSGGVGAYGQLIQGANGNKS